MLERADTCSQKPIVSISDMYMLLIKPWQLKIYHNQSIYTRVIGKHLKNQGFFPRKQFTKKPLIISDKKSTHISLRMKICFCK